MRMILKVIPLFCKLLLKFSQKHPFEFYLISFLVFCVIWPAFYPTRFGYQYESVDEMKNNLMPCKKSVNYSTNLPDCPSFPEHLISYAEVTETVNIVKLATMATKLKIEGGGHWQPHHCNPRYRVAIIVPYRDRKDQLDLFIQHMHPFLQQQQLDYGIFIIEQTSQQPFNRAKLFNVGYAEAVKRYDYCCFIFHDVDLIPENLQNLYACSRKPRHMSASLDIFRYVLPYAGLFGGVISISRSLFERVNGFSNLYFGWGGEDDDFYTRLRLSNISVVRWNPEISRYKMLVHEKAAPNSDRFILLSGLWERHTKDGINSLKYKVLNFELRPLYTWILVDLEKS